MKAAQIGDVNIAKMLIRAGASLTAKAKVRSLYSRSVAYTARGVKLVGPGPEMVCACALYTFTTF